MAQPLDLSTIDLSATDLFANDRHLKIFAALRQQAPVFLQKNHPQLGSFWNVTRYEDIYHVDTNHQLYSSQNSILIEDQDQDFPLPMFIAMDRPQHTSFRGSVSPFFTPDHINRLESLIRQRTQKVLDELPQGEPFDWVEKVSIELTSQMLATIFDFQFEHRSKLIRWSDVATALQGDTVVESQEQRKAELMECLTDFMALWQEKAASDPSEDLISMLAHGQDTQNMLPSEYLGNLVLLLVAGNDTTRNSMTGGVLGLNRHPEQYQLLRENPDLVPSLVNEIIRWQTPLAYMRRTALVDTELGGKHIKAGDKVVMWYASGNCDEQVFERGEDFIINRPKAKKQLAFGFGIHRCVGARLAELQLRILWQEIQLRFDNIEVVGEPQWLASNFVKGYAKLNVIAHRKT